MTVKVGVQIQQQGSDVDSILRAAASFDAMGVDSLWVWDHFFPIYGDPSASSFEAYTLVTAMATKTERTSIGVLVTGTAYRNAHLLADMARTIDHISGGRFILGIGSGWFERDYDEYGYEFGAPVERLRDLERDLTQIRSRFSQLVPAPVGRLPILVGGAGEKVTLRIVAEQADIWNGFGPASEFARVSGVLDQWCARVGRDPREIERTVALNVDEVSSAAEFIDAGATHLIVMLPHPFDKAPVESLIQARSTADR